MADETEPTDQPEVTVAQLMRSHAWGHSDDVEILRVLAEMAVDLTRDATTAHQDQVFAEFSNTADAFARYREEESASPGLTDNYVSSPGEPAATREQVLHELLEGVEYARFQFLVAAAAAAPERFREYIRAVHDEEAKHLLREAAVRAEDAERPAPYEVATAVYEAIVDSIPAEDRELITRRLHDAREAWQQYGSATLGRLTLFDYDQLNRPFGAPPLTGTRISELVRNAETTPAGQSLERTLRRREKSAKSATWRFYVEAFTANPDVVKLLRQHGEHETVEALLDRNAYDSSIHQAALRGEQLRDLARTDPDQFDVEFPQLTAADRETMRALAELASAIDGGEEPAREQAQAWYAMVGQITTALRREEAATRELRIQRKRQPAADERLLRKEQLLADLNEDAERARFQFLLAAATADPEAYQNHVIKIPATAVPRGLVNRSLIAGQVARDRADRSVLANLIRVHRTVVRKLPEDVVRRDRVSGAYRNARGMLRKNLATAAEGIPLVKAVGGSELAPDRLAEAVPLTRARIDEIVRQAQRTSSARKLDRRAAHHRRAASGQIGVFLAEAVAATSEATIGALTPALRTVVEDPTFALRVQRIRRETAEQARGQQRGRRRSP